MKLTQKDSRDLNGKLITGFSGDLSITETASVIAKKNDDGTKFINQYMVVEELGRYLNT